ncbi:MAG: hypothetical protein MJK04_08225, partial [Psychrosphaera sp.]|nr:hypothetical protein [Psychrosphaera sp.]
GNGRSKAIGVLLCEKITNDNDSQISFSAISTGLTQNALGEDILYALNAPVIKVSEGFAFTLDIDGNSAVKPFTDGILLIRYLFGFRDNILIAGAIAADATRTTAPEIEDYIQQGVDSSALDIDGNGSVEPFTDGLLCLRYLFGFRGAILIDQVVAADATRTTAEEIEAYIEQLY